MAAFTFPRRRSSKEMMPPELVEVIRLKDEFIELYMKDHPQLQQCIDRLCEIIETFENDYRSSTEGSSDAGKKGIVGGTAVLAGIATAVGIACAPLTMGVSILAVFVIGGSVLAGGIATLTVAGTKSKKCSSEKKHQLSQVRNGIKAELNTFQNLIKPLTKKMKDLQEQTGEMMRDFEKLQQQVRAFSENDLKEIARLTAQMSESMRLIAHIAEIYGGFSLALDMISLVENMRALRDMNKLAENPIKKNEETDESGMKSKYHGTAQEEINESEIKSKVGKVIVDMRKLILQLQNIIDELRKTKDQLAVY